MGRLNPYVYGADSLKGVARVAKLRMQGKDAEADRIEHESIDRFNTKGAKKK